MPDVNELINILRDLFYSKCNADEKLQSITQKLAEGTYSDAHDYSVRVGELLSEAFAEVLTEDIYPELTQEIARQIIPSLLGSDHRMISDACVTVQEHLNQNAGIGLKPIEPEFDVSRAYDLADKYVSYNEHEKAKWVLGEPVENYSQSVVDDSIRRNAEFHAKVGMSPKIVRKAESGACKWCRSLAGTYNFADVSETGNDVYRRHENCRCVVLYDPGDGKKQDVWSKKWYDNDADGREKRIENNRWKPRFSLDIQFFANITTPEKVQEFIRKLNDGEISKRFRFQKQKEHIFGTKEFERRLNSADSSGKGKITYFFPNINVNELLYDKLGTGEIVFSTGKALPTEFITLDTCVGKWYDLGKKEYCDAYTVAVQYSNAGWHAYPCKPKVTRDDVD